MKTAPRFFTIEEVADATQMSRAGLWRQCRDGKVAHHKMGRSYRFSESDLLNFISETRHDPAPVPDGALPMPSRQRARR